MTRISSGLTGPGERPLGRAAIPARLLCVGILLAGAAEGLLAQTPTPAPPPPPAAQAPPPTPMPTPKPYEDIIKLWQTKMFTEDFILRRIDERGAPYDLNADDIIRCRDSGVPENIINAMINKKGAPAASPAAAAQAAPAVPTAPSPATASRRWEGLARRTTGIVLKSRWKDVGYLEFREETLRWVDAHVPEKNLLIPVKAVKEQFLTCLKKAGGNECFEWGIKTAGEEYHFRDVAWEQGENAKVREVYEYLKGLYPNLVGSEVPVSEK